MKTKEEILRSNANVPKPQIPGVLEAMEEYAIQVTESKEKEIEHLKQELESLKTAVSLSLVK